MPPIELRQTAEGWNGGPLTWWPVTRAEGSASCGRSSS